MSNRFLIEEGTVLDALTSLTGWAASGGALTIEAPPIGGPATLCLTSNSGAQADARRSTPNWSVPDGYMIAVDVYSNSPAYYADGFIRVAGFSMDNAVTNYHQWPQENVDPNCWQTVLIAWHGNRLSTSGTGGSYAGTGNRHQTFNQLWLRARETAGIQTKTWFKNLRLVKCRPCVTIVWDDIHASNVDALAAYNEFGMKVGLAVITGKVGQADCMSRGQLDTAVGQGHELYPHSVNHLQAVLNQPGVSAQQLTDEVGGCVAKLDQWYGKKLSHRLWVAPYGERSALYDAAIIAADCKLVMGTLAGKNAPKLGPLNPTLPSLYRHLVYRSSNTHVTNLAHIQDAVGRGGMLCLGYHYHESGVYAGQTGDLWIQPARLRQMNGDLLAMERQAPVVLVSEWYREVTS